MPQAGEYPKRSTRKTKSCTVCVSLSISTWFLCALRRCYNLPLPQWVWGKGWVELSSAQKSFIRHCRLPLLLTSSPPVSALRIWWAGSVAWAKLKPKSSCWQDRKPNIFTQGLCVPGPGSLALGSSHFPFSCSRRKRDGTRDQSVNTPKVGNGELTLILTWLYIQLPCAGKPATHTANWDTWRKIKQNHCTGLLLSVDAATLLWPEPHRTPTRDNMLLWNTDVGEASAQPNSFVFQFVCY